MRKIHSLSIFLLIFLLVDAWASMDKCPEVSLIQKTGLRNSPKQGTEYGFSQVDKYNTQENWLFVINVPTMYPNPPYASISATDALVVAKSALKTLSFKTGPTPTSDYNGWFCRYESVPVAPWSSGFSIFAVTPPSSS